jgi:hypothetical protein
MAAQPAAQPYPQAQGPPSTSSVLWGEWRRGLKDLQNIALNPWQGWAATHEEPGTIANPTNIEVYKNRHQESTHPQVSVHSEVPMPTQESVRSPADLLEAKQNASIQGQQQSRQEMSPANLSEGKGVSQQQQQTQRQGQSHSFSM